MANQEGPVMGYPIQISYHHTAFRPTTTTTTTTSTTTATTTNYTAINTPTTRPFTTQNQPNTNIIISSSSSSTTTTPPMWQKCLALFSFVCLALFLAVGVPLLTVYLKPGVDNPMFQVDSVTVYPFNISSSHITANWDFSFTITNPNYDDSFYYDDIWASVFYKETYISSTTLGSFLQDNDGNYKRSVQATIAASSVHVNNSVASAIFEDWSYGYVNFPVTVNAIAKIDRKTKHKQQKRMIVSCDSMNVDFLENTTIGVMLGGPRKCRVSLHKLKK